MKTTVSLLISLFLFFGFVVFLSPSQAQVSEKDRAAGLENCFLYYDYGKVAVNLATDKPRYGAGETARILGTITNENTYPLIDVVVYAQLRRTNTSHFADYGHHLLDRIILMQPMNLLPKETRSISASIPVLDQYPGGSYELQYYVFSQAGFHYAGRPFLEEDYAGKSLFDIRSSSAPLVYFDVASLAVNGTPVTIRGPTREFEEETLRFTVSVADSRGQSRGTPVNVKYYAFEDTIEKNLLKSETVAVSTESGNIETSFTPPGSGAYVMIVRMEAPAISELKYRFAKIGDSKPPLRINDLGVTAYPPTLDDKAYVCIHSPARDATPLTTVTLRILDGSKKVHNQKSVTHEFSGDVLALTVPFESALPGREFFVQTTKEWQDETGKKLSETSEILYTCDTFKYSPTELKVSYESSTAALAISAVNACGATIQSGGFIESILIQNDNGDMVKEMYNVQSLSQNLIMSDLPDGKYTAVVKSGPFEQEAQFMIAGSSWTGKKAKNSWLIIAIICLIILLLAAVIYYIKRKRKHKQP